VTGINTNPAAVRGRDASPRRPRGTHRPADIARGGLGEASLPAEQAGHGPGKLPARGRRFSLRTPAGVRAGPTVLRTSLAEASARPPYPPNRPATVRVSCPLAGAVSVSALRRASAWDPPSCGHRSRRPRRGLPTRRIGRPRPPSRPATASPPGAPAAGCGTRCAACARAARCSGRWRPRGWRGRRPRRAR